MKFIHILSLCMQIASVLSERRFSDNHRHSIQRRAAPAPRPDGICKTYTIQQGDNCQKLAERYQITVSNIETWNKGSWGWSGCPNTKQGDFVCISPGALPMPVALPRATCGPQVPGTKRPYNYADLASLNPCPSDQCCAKSGLCGTSAATCDAARACIFNCGEKKKKQRATSSGNTHSIKSKTTTSRKSSTTSKMTTTKKITTSKPTTVQKATTSKPTTSKKTTSKTTISSTTTKKEVKTAETSPVPTGTRFSMVLYEKKDCKGNYYYVQGNNATEMHNDCFSFSTDTQTEISDIKRSCRWWYNEGLDWTSCSKGTLTWPQAWTVQCGNCYVYKDKHCNERIGKVHGWRKKCNGENKSPSYPVDAWGSLRCFGTGEAC